VRIDMWPMQCCGMKHFLHATQASPHETAVEDRADVTSKRAVEAVKSFDRVSAVAQGSGQRLAQVPRTPGY
jgi:hypothetical protein